MRKNIKNIFVLLIILTLAVSCNMENKLQPNVGSVLITCETEENSKNAYPNGSLETVTVANYTVVGTGPAGRTVTKTITKAQASSFALPNLIVGDWSFIAYGLNSSGEKIAKSNNTAVTVKTDKTSTAKLIVAAFQDGKGSINYTVSFDKSQFVTGAKVYGSYMIAGTNTPTKLAERAITSAELSTGSLVYNFASLNAGSYIISVTLKNTDGVEASVMDAAFVLAGKQSTGSGQAVVGGAGIINGTVNDGVGTVLNPILTVSKKTALAGEEVTITANCSYSGTLTYTWFVNNVKQTTTTNIFKYMSSKSAIDDILVIVKGQKIGEIGSAFTTIKVIKGGYVIEPGKTIDFIDLSAPLAQDQICVGYYVDNSSKAVKSWKDSVDFPYKNTGSSNVTLSPIIVPMNSVLKNTTSSGKTTINSDANAPYSFINATIYADTTLRYLELPEGVSQISANSFNGSKLKGIKVPTSLEVLGSSSFKDCVLLQTIDLSLSKLTAIEDFIFSGCSVLETVLVPNGLKIIGQESFCFCAKLTTIELPDNLTTINACAFAYCTSLKTVKIPTTTASLGMGAFMCCVLLEKIEIPNVEVIESYTFHYCKALKSIKIPTSVKTIKAQAFSECYSLSFILIPITVENLENLAFNKWTNTQKIRIEAVSKPAGWNSDWYRNSSAKIVLSNYNLPEITIENLSKGSTLDYKSSEPGAYGLTVGSMQNNYIANHKYYQRAFAKYTTTNQKPEQMTLYAQNGWQTIKQAYSPTANVEYYLSGFTISNSACLDNKNHNIYCEPSNAIDGVTTHGKQSMTFDLDAPTNNGKSLNNYFDNAGYTTDAEKLSILDLLPYFAETFTFSGR